MKRIIAFILFVAFIFCVFFNALAEYNPNPLGVDEAEIQKLVDGAISNAIIKLKAMDIVRNSEICSKDYITRRNAFEILHIIYQRGCRELNDGYDTKTFYDVEEGTYDYHLAETLNYEGVFRGKIDGNGNKIADFDTNITYYEAMTAMSRMLGNHYQFSNKIGNSTEASEADPYPYFTLFEEIGIINSNTRINYSTLTVTEDMLNQYIPAREYLYMIYNMLFVPNVYNGCYGGTVNGFKYIDYFIDYRKGDLSHWEDSSFKITT